MNHMFSIFPVELIRFGFYPVLPWVVRLCEGLVNSKFSEKALEETFLEIIDIFEWSEGGRPTCSIILLIVRPICYEV